MTATLDLAAQLPNGITVIDASAGTGKTYTISGLVTIAVAAHGVPVEAVLVVTFTRKAAGELRERIRDSLEEAASAIRRTLAGEAVQRDDPILDVVVDAERPELLRRLARLGAAIADFDTATIGTIHSFAQTLIGERGISPSIDPDAVLLEDTSVVLDQALSDELAARGIADLDPVDVQLLRKSAKLVDGRRIDGVVPSVPALEDAIAQSIADGKSVDSGLGALVGTVEALDGVERRARQIRQSRSISSFDDVLTAARDLVTDPVAGPAVAEAVGGRVRLALIDEFQDTDAVQWELLSTVFDSQPLVLVGDPKQSIYRFRGADVRSYLAASEHGNRHTLEQNFRSDGRFLRGAEALLSAADFGDPRIRFTSVTPGRPDRAELVQGDSSRSGVELRIVPDRRAPAGVADDEIAQDTARQIVGLLTDGRIPDERSGMRRAVEPGDIAVLVRSHAAAPAVQHWLRSAGVPAVIGRVGSVAETEAATQLLTVLRAIAVPASERRVRAAGIGWFLRRTWAELAPDPGVREAGDPGLVTDLQQQLARWAVVAEKRGTAALFDSLWHSANVAAHLLSSDGGLRQLTDLEHLRELLLRMAPDGGVNALVETLESMMANLLGEEDLATELLARRTDVDDRAVQIMSVHAAKGLEFPIVFGLGLHKTVGPVRPELLDESEGTTLWLGTTGMKLDGVQLIRERLIQELRGEYARLLYVAVTRARHLAVLTVGKNGGKEPTPLETLIGGKFASAAGAREVLGERLSSAGGALRVEEIDVSSPLGRWRPDDTGEPPHLRVAEFDRTFDRSARRWSFTAISGRRVGAGDYTEPGSAASLGRDAPESGATDEATPDGLTFDDSDAPGSALPLGNVGGGAAFGTLVHSVLEHLDFASSTLRDDLDDLIGSATEWTEWAVDRADLTHGLMAAIDTPMGPGGDDRALRSFGTEDVLDELDFEIPLGGGQPPDQRATVRAIGQLAADHLVSGDPLRPWASELALGGIEVDLTGHLTGSIDAVLRDGDRFVVVDYKTNRLGPYGEPRTIEAYGPDGMNEGMVEHDYPLQALLYSVAVHRFLRWRLGALYSPVRHLGGARYLFVRGMIGTRTPVTEGVRHGVFEWAIPPALVSDLSDLLDGGSGS